MVPTKPKRPCSYPGCPKLTDGRFCEEHAKAEAKRYEKYDRDPAVRRRYGRAWKRIRDRYRLRAVEHRHEHVDALRARRKQIAHQSVILGRVGSGHQSERVGHFGFPCAVRRRLTHRLNGHRHTGQYQNYLSHFLFIGLRLG